jgi:hypothetical protein
LAALMFTALRDRLSNPRWSRRQVGERPQGRLTMRSVPAPAATSSVLNQ